MRRYAYTSDTSKTGEISCKDVETLGKPVEEGSQTVTFFGLLHPEDEGAIIF